jgi:hypothetical protein
MDTTPTLEMLTTPNSRDNKKAINKQIKFINRGLRATRCIVAGGAPRDHLDGVAAADLDFYVPDLEGAYRIREALGMGSELSEIWSLETRGMNPQTGTLYAGGTSEQYLQFIFEGVASSLGDTVKVNIMVLQPQIEINTRSDLIVEVLKNFPEGTSHHVYTIHGGDLLLLQHDQCCRVRSINSPPEYREKALRKLMLRDSPLLESQLRSGTSAWVCSEYYSFRVHGNKPKILCLSRGTWIARKITQKGGVALRATYPSYAALQHSVRYIPAIDIQMFNQYEEGEVSYAEYIKHLQTETERYFEAQGGVVTYTTNDLSTLRSTLGEGGSSPRPLPQHGVTAGSTTSAVQSSRRAYTQLVDQVRAERERVVQQVSNQTGSVRFYRTDTFTTSVDPYAPHHPDF